MRVRTICIILLLLATAACSAYRTEFDINPSYAPHYFRHFDVEVTWRSTVAGEELQLKGMVTNRRYTYMQDLELTARLLDEKGGVLATKTMADFPRYIPSGKGEPFQTVLTIPAGSAPARFRFSYKYWLAEEPLAVMGYGGYEDVPHFGDFEAPL
jgi:hypothetical protein